MVEISAMKEVGITTI